MKKTTPIILSLAAALLLSCGTAGPSSSEAASIPSVESSESSIESSGLPPVDINTTYESHAWDDRVVEMLAFAVGDVASKVPSFQTTDYAVSIFQDEDSGYIVTDVKCYPCSATADNSYENKLFSEGFLTVSDSQYGYQKASVTDDLIVQYSVVESTGFSYLSIMAYRVSNRLASWPSELVDALVPNPLPVMQAESYEAWYDTYNDRGVIYANNVASDADATYRDQLIAAGFVLQSTSLYSYSLVSSDGWVTVDLYMTYDAYNDDALLIRFADSWPYMYLNAILGEDLPKLDVDPSLFSYGFVKTSSGESVLTLYYDSITEVGFTTYCSLLEAAGWSLDGSEGSATGTTSSGIRYAYYAKGEHMLDVLYQESSGTIAIPVYC